MFLDRSKLARRLHRASAAFDGSGYALLADNYLTNANTTSGSTFASDDISSVHYPRVKPSWGADGAAVDTSVAAPMPVQTTLETNQMVYGGTVATPKFAVISASSSGDNEIVASVSSRKIRILSYVIVSAGTVNVTWRSGTTPKTGAMPLIANTGVASGFNPVGHCETAATTALNLNLSAAIGVFGHVTYVEVA